MQMRHLALATLPLLFLAAGCGSDDDSVCNDTEVQSQADPDVDFTAYETFAIAPDSAYPALPPDLPASFEDDLQSANDDAADQLEDAGLTKVAYDDDPDLVIFTAAASETDTGVEWDCTGGYYWWGWYDDWDPCAWLEPIPVEYTVGVIVTGVADAAEEKVVFGGAVAGVLDCGDSSQRLSDGIADIFADYPADQTGD